MNNEKNIEKLLNGVRTLAIVCNQFGDTGKGKLIDFFGEWPDGIARGTGGANAGHTIQRGEKKYVFHLVPSGILYDNYGKINIIGSGTALDPRVVCEELNALEKEKLSYNNLYIALNARLVLPQHLVLDRVRESASKQGRIGTTGRGIGPVYADYYARVGLFVNDMLNTDVFVRKLRRNIKEKVMILGQYDPSVVQAVMRHEHLGRFWSAGDLFDLDAIVETYRGYGKRLAHMIEDTDSLLQEMRNRGRKILLEGTQGNLLGIDTGTYPYVTSADCSVRGLAQGVGLRERDIDLSLGIVKAFYMTRVGEGPFPTEIGGEQSAEWCADSTINKKSEAELYPLVDVNDPDPFHQGIGIRKAGNEYGATTGRPRRTGWLDLPFLRYSIRHTGPNVALTKLDVLDKCQEIKICTEYVYRGPDYRWGKRVFRKGDILPVAIPDCNLMAYCHPLYESFYGWQQSIRHAKTYGELPQKLRELIGFVRYRALVDIKIVSVGPDREQTIVVD